MGFPKPWPTEWPEPLGDEPARPPDSEEQEGAEERDELPYEVPEYQRQFYAVTWAVNHACNLRCTHCYDVVAYRRRDLATEDALSVIDRLAAAEVSFIAFSGGEAFLRPDLFELMAHARAHGMQFGARSNGTRITDAVAKRLRELGISVVGVSFDGATPETHDAVRGTGGFAAALAGMRALVSHGIRAQMEVVLSRQNLHEAERFIEVGAAAGAAEVNFSIITPQGRGAQRMDDLLDHATWQQVTAQLREASKCAELPVTPNCALLGPCVAAVEPHITCDGWMTACYLSSAKLFNLLDIEPSTIREHLTRARTRSLDICGRRRWIHPQQPAALA